MQAKTSLDEHTDGNEAGPGGKPGPAAEVSRTVERREPRATGQDLAGAEAKLRIGAGADHEWQSHQCRLATPMYGGGVHAGELDRSIPIRAASIRGQLRFWWRIVSANTLDPKEMFKREAAIWGGIGSAGPTASRVRVRVQSEPVRDSDRLRAPDKPQARHGYAFGPAIIGNTEQWLLEAGYPFVLKLRYPGELADEVEKTLRWWAAFGGIGARTRRGFGAVHIGRLASWSDAGATEAVEKAGGWLCFGSDAHDGAVGAWEFAVGKLRRFRQQGAGRLDASPTGRSYWPEADQIRRFTRRNDNHRHDPVHAAGNVFPRAAFGLPINFQFKDRNDPGASVLLPAGSADRRASPLILRPYWNGEKWRPAALLLPGWRDALEQPLRFKSGKDVPAHWPKDEDRRAEVARLISPMKTADGSLRGTDPLSAFMHFFAEKT